MATPSFPARTRPFSDDPDAWNDDQVQNLNGARGMPTATDPLGARIPNATSPIAMSGTAAGKAALRRPPPVTLPNNSPQTQAGTSRLEMATSKEGRSALRNLDDVARRTPGVLGASSGGAGMTPNDVWRKWFPKAGGSAGIANPPPATNRLPGDSGAASLASAQPVRSNVAAAINPPATGTESAGRVAQIAANNAAIYRPGGTTSPVVPAPTAPASYEVSPTAADMANIAKTYKGGGSVSYANKVSPVGPNVAADDSGMQPVKTDEEDESGDESGKPQGSPVAKR